MSPPSGDGAAITAPERTPGWVAQDARGFLGLDAMAAHLGLVVDAAVEGDLAIGAPRGAVAGAVEALAVDRHERGGGEVGLVAIAARDLRAADIDFALLAIGDGLALAVEDADRRCP